MKCDSYFQNGYATINNEIDEQQQLVFPRNEVVVKLSHSYDCFLSYCEHIFYAISSLQTHLDDM